MYYVRLRGSDMRRILLAASFLVLFVCSAVWTGTAQQPGQAAIDAARFTGKTDALENEGAAVGRRRFEAGARTAWHSHPRGQLLFEPTDTMSFRLIGDYTWRKERCCAAVYVNDDMNDDIDGLNDPAQNNIIRVLRDLGQDLAAFDDGFDRNVSVTPGRSYSGKTKDGGLSLEGKFDLGGAELTSITGWRYYKADQGGDFDYGTVDILYRPDDGSSSRKFKTFSQEARFQGARLVASGPRCGKRQ